MDLSNSERGFIDYRNETVETVP